MLELISLETPQRKWASSRLEGRTSCIFSSCGRCSRLTTGTSGTRSDGLRKGQSPCELLRGVSGFHSHRCRGLSPLWSRCRKLRIPPQATHGSWGTSGVSPGGSVLVSSGGMHALSSRAEAAVSRFPSRGSRDLWLTLEAFPRRFPTGMSHMPPWCKSILGLKVEAVQGKQVSLEWTETSGGLCEW